MTADKTVTLDFLTAQNCKILDELCALRCRASVLGKPTGFVSSYERGERRLDVLEFCHIVDGLRADAAATFRGSADGGKKAVAGDPTTFESVDIDGDFQEPMDAVAAEICNGTRRS